jgi:NAD(P)-dependent dehydrogenase (short-subunit alcohol dehydrogenase family)
MKYDLKGKVAVITGAGSGIGRAVARLLATGGCRLALADINETGLRETGSLVGGSPLLGNYDVSDRTAVLAFAKQVLDRFGAAHIIVNNAGVSLVQNVADMQYEDFKWLMGINFWGAVHGTTAFLPALLEQKDGVVVNVSSALGLVAMPTQSAYAAAKHAVRGFTESLRLELIGTGVHALCVYPGGVKTNIAKAGRYYNPGSRLPAENRATYINNFDRMAKMPPERAAGIIVRGIERLNPRILVGSDVQALDVMQRIMPVATARLMAKLTPKIDERTSSAALKIKNH